MTAAVDQFADLQPGLDSAYGHAFAVSVSDTVDFTNATRAIMVAGAGTIQANTAGDKHAGGESSVLIQGLLAGVVYPLRLTRIFNTNTNCTGITGFW